MSRTTSPSEHDYAAIEAAVMETERGRWFLAEHAARHRVADTETILSAIGRMGAASPAVSGHLEDCIKDIGAILAMARAVARGSAPESSPPHLRPMQIADGAITAVRRVSEKIHDVASELRENARAPVSAEALDLYCRDLDTASALQEKAILQLSELAGVVDAIEQKLASLRVGLALRPAAPARDAIPAPGAELPAVPAEPAIAASAPVATPAPTDAAPRSVEAPPIQHEALSPASTTAGKEPPRRTLLLVQPSGPKR